MIERGAVQFAITIPGDFTRRVVRRDKPQILVEADASDPAATGAAVSALAALPDEALKHALVGTLTPIEWREEDEPATPALPDVDLDGDAVVTH